MRSMNKFSSRVSPSNVKTCIAYSGTKFSSNISKFQSKYHAKNDLDLVYYAKCLEEKGADYTGEIGKRLIERVKHHSGKDLKSYLFEGNKP